MGQGLGLQHFKLQTSFTQRQKIKKSHDVFYQVFCLLFWNWLCWIGSHLKKILTSSTCPMLHERDSSTPASSILRLHTYEEVKIPCPHFAFTLSGRVSWRVVRRLSGVGTPSLKKKKWCWHLPNLILIWYCWISHYIWIEYYNWIIFSFSE